ncbi:hypothetical protein SR39_31575, partial [Methylobacterium radiotolerans]
KKKRKGYRALYDYTMRAIKRGEKFEAQLEKMLAKKGSRRGPNDPTVMLLDSTQRGVEALQREAGRLEKLGWPDKIDD